MLVKLTPDLIVWKEDGKAEGEGDEKAEVGGQELGEVLCHGREHLQLSYN